MRQPRQRKKNARNSRRIYIGNSKLFSLYNCFPLPPPVTITIRAFEKLTLDNQKFTVKNETK